MNSEDRRAPGAARIPFDSLVEVGGALGPSFEAQAVNLSEEGMQLRTAYLPELGQEITCRFETAPNESVVGSGEVVWCRGAEKGGEFGIRFTDVDADSIEALKRACGFGGAAAPAQPGAKVRLYIDGLASPMRAKIRDAHKAAITVGSELGFLQVGKQLELEDAQSGTKRPANIDRVEVAVDPSSHVPQLIVRLRYADMPAEAAEAQEAPEAPDNLREPDDLAGLDDPSARMKSALSRQAARIGPALRRLAQRVGTTVALLAKRRRLEDDGMRRRTTAPAPGGGLHATGRRVVRGEAGPLSEAGSTAPMRRGQLDPEPTSPAKPIASKRLMWAAAAVMITVVAGGLAIKKSQHPAAAEGAPSAASSVEAPASAAGAAPSITASAAAVAGPPQPVAWGSAPTVSVSGELPPPPGPTAMGEDNASVPPVRKAHRPTPFGNGSVHHGNLLRLKMDGPIESIEGAQQPTGFIVKVPGRKSLEAAAPLAARDSRIASIRVTNASAGAELTVAFKDGVPNYQVSGRGDNLVISLAPIGRLETVAKRDETGERAGKHMKLEHDATPER